MGGKSMKSKGYKNKKCKYQPRSGTYVKVINCKPQFREIDRRNETGDFTTGAGLNEPDPNENNLYLYAGRVFNGDQEVGEIFTDSTEQLCMVDGLKQIGEIPVFCTFDRRRNAVFYQFQRDSEGVCRLCVKRPLTNARRFIDKRCLQDSTGRYYTFETREFPATKKKLRLKVSESCNSKLIINTDCTTKFQNLGPQNCKPTKYQQRRQHFINKTNFDCNSSPRVNRVIGSN